MTPYYQTDEVTVYHGDCVEVMAQLADNSIDAVVTDPPYGLEFMGKDWDGTNGFRRSLNQNDVGRDSVFGRQSRTSPEYRAGSLYQHWCQVWASECLRVLKPGGHMLTFGGTRTFHRLACAVEDAGFEIRDNIAWIYGSGFPKSLDVSKAIDRAAGVLEPEGVGFTVAGYSHMPDKILHTAPSAGYKPPDPVTDAAKQWQGWGTALKPSWENVVHAVKPEPLAGIIGSIGSRLDQLERDCKPPVNDAAENSEPIRQDLREAMTDSVPESAAIPPEDEAGPTTATGGAEDSSDPMGMSPSESEMTTFWNTVTSWRQCWVELCDLTSTFTTATNVGLTTDLRTLNSCLSQITPDTTTADQTQPNGLSYLVSAADNLFGACVLSLRATHMLSVTEPASDSMRIDCQAADVNRLEPIVVARKPLSGTVAANVQQWGTGALNIDATRVPTSAKDAQAMERANTPNSGRMKAGGSPINTFVRSNPTGAMDTSAGRWPPNVVLDEAAAAELDQQSGNVRGLVGMRKLEGEYRFTETNVDTNQRFYQGESDSGGASRYFPVFKYAPKAPQVERPSVDGVSHPTCKPLELMRWLVRLVTPPHGVVLDPFAGTGTTAEACIHEHKHAIVIEREAEYLPLIVARLHKPMQVGFDFEAQT